ncbi:MAG: hypothetical protein Q9188_000097 [Gyalolechia gomerana]
MPSEQDDLILCNPLARAGALSPAQDALDNVPSSGQKRKYHGGENVSAIWETFEIRVCEAVPKKSFGKAYEFCLLLAYLDTTGSHDFEQEPRCFSADIPALESSCFDGDSDSTPRILVAECNGKSLHAIERIRPGVYAQCRLGNWMTLEGLKERSSNGSAGHRSKRPCLDKMDRWWRGVVARERRESPCIESRVGERHLTHIFDLAKPAYVSKTPASSVEEVPFVKPADLGHADSHEISPQEPSQLPTEQPSQDPDDLLRTIKAQYLESLYKSRASLAYFAKGPLSRARAAFSDSSNVDASPQRLVEHLRTLIIPLNLLDKKYRETLPALVTGFSNSIVSEGEHIEVAAKMPKDSRKPKKDRIGKTGLYPQEEANIQQWWLDRLASVPVCTSAELRDEAIKATLLQHRTREIYLQIILILEILALERVLPVSSVQNTLDDLNDSQQHHKKQKPKKQQDLGMLLDLSVDKLCIWQSMAIEEHKASGKSRGTEAVGIGTLPSKTPDTGHLREFCVDVVLPFYDARLPEASRTLCKKLGGPLPHSAARPALKRAASSSLRPQKPGAAVDRPQPREARRTLERVLTDEKTSRRPTPPLCRSATDSFLPTLKREPSDVSMPSVPLNRSTFHKSNRYSQREVDLTAVSQAAEAKAKKKADVEQELQGAIAALKRPNPRMAVKEFVEAADRRAAGLKARKSKNPVRNSFAQGVQIMATPSANRRRNVFNSLHSQQPQPPAVDQEVEEIPPSSCTHVPASITKERTDRVAGSRLDTVRHRMTPTVEQTPTRGASKSAHVQFADKPRLVGESVELTPSSLTRVKNLVSVQETCQKPGYRKSLWTTGVWATPSKKTTTIGPDGNLPSLGVEGTPMKQLKSVSENVTRSSYNTVSSPASNEGGGSIYKNLGWDDDVDELM